MLATVRMFYLPSLVSGPSSLLGAWSRALVLARVSRLPSSIDVSGAR